MDIGMPQLDNDFSSLSDPADWPTNLTDLQKQKGKKENNVVLSMGGLKSFPTWNIVARRMIWFRVLFAAYSQKNLEEKRLQKRG